MATTPPKNPATEEQYDLQRGLAMIRRDAIKKGIKAPVANLTDPGFREVMFGPLSRSKKLTRTDDDIRVAVNLWCTNRDAAEKQYGHISDWDVSNVTNMDELFAGKTTFNDDITRWDVSNVTDMSYMFYNANEFDQDLRMWKVANVTKSNSIFLDCNISYENKPAKFGGSGGAKKSKRSKGTSKKRSRKGRRTLKRGARRTRRR